jgi:hypothetical protein
MDQDHDGQGRPTIPKISWTVCAADSAGMCQYEIHAYVFCAYIDVMENDSHCHIMHVITQITCPLYVIQWKRAEFNVM